MESKNTVKIVKFLILKILLFLNSFNKADKLPVHFNTTPKYKK